MKLRGCYSEKITTENSGAVVNTGTEIGKGIYALSKDGQLDISNLPMSTGEAKYYFEKVALLDNNSDRGILARQRLDVLAAQ